MTAAPWVEPTYPILVRYPHGGARYLARWHTHHQQYSLIVAASRAGMLRALRYVLEGHQDATVHDVLRVVLAAPPRWAVEAHQAARMAYDRASIWGYVGMRLGAHADRHGVPPPGVVRCTRAVADWDTIHEECGDCYGGFVIPGTDRETLYRTRKALIDAYESARVQRHGWQVSARVASRVPPAVPSRARVAGEDQTLWAVRADFGHHQGGVGVARVQRVEAGSFEDVLFLFVGLEDAKDGEVTDLVASVQRERDARVARIDEGHRAQREAREREADLREQRFLDLIIRGAP